MTIKTGRVDLEDEDALIGTLVNLTRQKNFRSAWTYLQKNIDPQHIRVYDAGVLLQQLSNEYGDIELKEDCHLRKVLDAQSNLIIKLLT